MKNPWSDRWEFVKDYIPNNVSIVDFGCGNREVLDYVKPSKYLGIDRCDTADIVADLDQPVELQEQFDLGLLLGVLEYLDDPAATLNNIAGCAKSFVVVTLAVKKKPEWRQAFDDVSIDQLLRKFFSTVEHHRHGSYILSVCNNETNSSIHRV